MDAIELRPLRDNGSTDHNHPHHNPAASPPPQQQHRATSHGTTLHLTLVVILLAVVLVLVQTNVPKIARKSRRTDSQALPPLIATTSTTEPKQQEGSIDTTSPETKELTPPPPQSTTPAAPPVASPNTAVIKLSSGDYWARGSWGRIVALSPGCWVHPSIDSYAMECDEHVFGPDGTSLVTVKVEVVSILRVTDVACRSCKQQQQAVGAIHWMPNKTRTYGGGGGTSFKNRDDFYATPAHKKELVSIPVEVETIRVEKGACNATLATFTGACVAAFDFRVVVHDVKKFGNPAPEVCFVSIGDWGSPRPSMLGVAKLLERVVRTRMCKFVLSTGDNFYPVGVSSLGDPQWMSTFEQPFGAAVLQNLRWYIVAGNHDAWGLPPQREYMKEHPRWHFPAYAYAESIPLFRDTVKHSAETIELSVLFSAGRNQLKELVMCDNFYDTVSVRHGGPGQDVSRHWRVLANHEPMYSGGMHGVAPRQRVLRDMYLPHIRRNRVHMYVNGDDHMLEVHRSKGTDFFVSGAGGGSAFYHTSPMPDTVKWQKLGTDEYFGVMLHCFQGDTLETTLLNTAGDVLYVHKTAFDVNPADFE